MRMNFGNRLFWGTICFTIGAFLLIGLFTAIKEKGMGSSDAAGWVQALGAIAAIAGAIYLMNAQHLLQVQLENDREASHSANLLLVAIMFGQETTAMLATLAKLDSEHNTLEVGAGKFALVQLTASLEYAERSPMRQLPHDAATKFAMIRQTCRGLIAALSAAEAERSARVAGAAPTALTTNFPRYVRGANVFASVRAGIEALPDLVQSLRASYRDIKGHDAPT